MNLSLPPKGSWIGLRSRAELVVGLAAGDVGVEVDDLVDGEALPAGEVVEALADLLLEGLEDRGHQRHVGDAVALHRGAEDRRAAGCAGGRRWRP
jgi:hypothetical protein